MIIQFHPHSQALFLEEIFGKPDKVKTYGEK